jgi:hypothetical protein
MDNPGRGPSIKKARILNNSPNILNDVLELDYTISFNTKEGDLLAIVSRKDSITKGDSSTLKDSVSTTGDDNSTTKGYDSTIGGNSSSIEDSTSLKTNTEPLIASEPFISIRYFENYLSWIVDLNYDSF